MSLTMVDCTKNATSIPTFLVIDTYNMEIYGKITKFAADRWLAWYAHGIWGTEFRQYNQNLAFDTPDQAYEFIVGEYAAECSTP